MDKAGHSLSKSCVNALVDAGEVSQAEIESPEEIRSLILSLYCQIEEVEASHKFA